MMKQYIVWSLSILNWLSFPKFARWALWLDLLLYWCGSCSLWLLLLSSWAKWCSACLGSITRESLPPLCSITFYIDYFQPSNSISYSMLILTNLLLLEIVDDHCIHFDHFNIYYWKDWWAQGNTVHHSFIVGRYS